MYCSFNTEVKAEKAMTIMALSTFPHLIRWSEKALKVIAFPLFLAMLITWSMRDKACSNDVISSVVQRFDNTKDSFVKISILSRSERDAHVDKSVMALISSLQTLTWASLTSAEVGATVEARSAIKNSRRRGEKKQKRLLQTTTFLYGHQERSWKQLKWTTSTMKLWWSSRLAVSQTNIMPNIGYSMDQIDGLSILILKRLGDSSSSCNDVARRWWRHAPVATAASSPSLVFF